MSVLELNEGGMSQSGRAPTLLLDGTERERKGSAVDGLPLLRPRRGGIATASDAGGRVEGAF